MRGIPVRPAFRHGFRRVFPHQRRAAPFPLNDTLKKFLPWIPVFAIAASLGFSAALIRKHLSRRAGVVVAGDTKTYAPRPRPAVAVIPAEPAIIPVKSGGPALARASAWKLSVYSKFNCVAVRDPGVPDIDAGDTPENFRLRHAVGPDSVGGPSWSFRLMFPTPDAIGSSALPAPYSPAELAMAVYAETGGLFPVRTVRGSVYDPYRWNTGFGPGGYGDLTLARRMVAETRKRNKRTHLAPFPVDRRLPSLIAWYCCAESAEDAVGASLYPLPPGMRLHFFIRQKGVGRQKAAYLEKYTPVMSFGPFFNVGGGDVPAGDKAYIDFYVLPVR